MGKAAYYFSHDSNARTDTKIMAMLCDYKAIGYGCYWAIVEMLSEQDGYKLKLNKLTFNAIAMAMLCDCDTINKFVNSCINEYELFESDGEYFWSNSLIRRMEIKEAKRKKRSEAGKKGAESRWKTDNLDQNNSNAMAMPLQTDSTDIAKDGKEKESKENKSKENIYIVQSEQLWNLYPSKTGKANAIKKIPKLIKQYSYEQIERCIERYKQYVINRRNTDFPTLKYQNGSTFFNSGYVDYLDENYKPLQPVQEQRANAGAYQEWKRR
jgi:hypothetical protein